jgi:hypothetical protein
MDERPGTSGSGEHKLSIGTASYELFPIMVSLKNSYIPSSFLGCQGKTSIDGRWRCWRQNCNYC